MSRTTVTSVEGCPVGQSGFTEPLAQKPPLSLRAVGAALFPPRVVLFVVVFAWFMYTVVDLRLIFQAQDKLFLWSLRYFTDYIGRPGLLLEWADSLFVQLCYYGWPALIVLSAALWLIMIATIEYMNALGRRKTGGTWVIPGFVIMVICSRYTFHSGVIIAPALAMTAVVGWIKLPVRRLGLRWVLFILLSAVLYYVTNQAYYSFAACCVIYEVFAEKRRVSSVLLVVAAVGVKLGVDAYLRSHNLATLNFHTPALVDYKTTPLNPLAVLLFAYFPACALCLLFWRRVGDFMKRLFRGGRKSPGENPLAQPAEAVGLTDAEAAAGKRLWLHWIIATGVLLFTEYAWGNLFFSREMKLSLELDYCSEHKLWDDLLAKAGDKQFRFYSAYMNHDINLALYHTGHLPDRMFSYPQMFRPLFSFEQVSKSIMIRKPCDLFLELGRVNEAEHEIFEMWELSPTGGALKRLALINMIKGQTAAASVFLNILRDDLVWGGWADGYLRRMGSDPELKGDADIQRTRGLMVSQDDTFATRTMRPDYEVSVDIIACLSKLLEQNNQNRMAFEYLMAIYLLSGDVDKAVETLSYFDNFSYAQMPRDYEEAILIYGIRHPREVTVKENSAFFRSRKLSSETLSRYRRLREILDRCGGQNEKIKLAVASEFKSGYFRYYYYSHQDFQ